MKKIAILGVAVIAIFVIYINSVDNKLNYISLGDSLAAGQNPYKQITTGYSDYVKEYLKKNDLLDDYNKDFAISGQQTKDLIIDIENNKKITIANKTIAIQQVLKKADIITLSIGSNDIFMELGFIDMSFNLEKINDGYEIIDKVGEKLDKLLKLIKRYNNNDIFLIGYYNPLTSLSTLYVSKLEPLFIYLNNSYREIAKNNNIEYIEIYNGFRKNTINYLPNPSDAHPSTSGYQYIASKIIEEIENKVIN